MIGRSAGLPGPEAIITWAAVATAIAFSALVPGFQAAVVVYALLPLVSGAVLWWWLARRLGVGFDGWRDVLVTGAVAFAAGAAGFGARSAAESMGASPVAVIFAAAIAWAAVVLPAGAKLKLIGSREWEVLKGLGDGQPVVP
jgi:hypothetical protein